MVLYSAYPGSPFSTSFYLRQTLKYLAEQEGRTLFTIKSVTLGCSQTVLNPDGKAVADVVEVTMRSSTIGTNTVDLQFFYDPYDWSFPPDLIIHGSSIKPSLSDIGLDDSWNHEDPANLKKVLGKLARIIQHGERQRVATCDNERIQVEYSCLQDVEDMDCCLIPGVNEPTKVRDKESAKNIVLFWLMYDVVSSPVLAKIQFLISSLVPNDVTAVQSKIEALSPFDFPDLVQSIPDIGKQETIVTFIERVSEKITDHFEKLARARRLRKEFMEKLTATFRSSLLECDASGHRFAAFLFTVPKEKSRPEAAAIVTFQVSDSFPDEYPKMVFSAPILPSDSYASTPAPEVVPIHRYNPRWDAERIIREIW
ncbi:MAG: hypothetical protein J3Q66DRAFT_362976 [Benniella sp.]|nr:MAG: hypothetical protein J3Q66DRAFT_362976 [Benniella sp.]